jgi:hypothetical protein
MLFNRGAILAPKFSIVLRMQWPARALEFAPLLHYSVTIKMRVPPNLLGLEAGDIYGYVQYRLLILFIKGLDGLRYFAITQQDR